MGAPQLRSIVDSVPNDALWIDGSPGGTWGCWRTAERDWVEEGGRERVGPIPWAMCEFRQRPVMFSAGCGQYLYDQSGAAGQDGRADPGA